MFSIMTIASSTTNPVAIVIAINVRLFRLYPSRYITPNVPTSDNGTATLGITVPDDGAQEEKNHEDDERDRQHEFELNVLHRGADRVRAIGQNGDID